MTAAARRRIGVTTNDAPEAIGPYSQAIRCDDLLWCSGALPLDPTDGSLANDSLATETDRCLRNLQAVCRAAGGEIADAVRVTIYTTALERFAEINDAYAEFFHSPPPARVTIGVAALPKAARVEIDAVVPVR